MTTPSYSLPNKLSQLLDIAGSPSKNASRLLSDESAGLGVPTGASSAATVASVVGGSVRLSLPAPVQSDATAYVVGNFIEVSGASNAVNNGVFLITARNTSNGTVTFANASAITEGTSWTVSERKPYSLLDDLDFARSDRQAIKGVDYNEPVPTFQRPTAIGTDVDASLANLAGKTTDALGFVFTRAIRNNTPVVGATSLVVSSAGNLKHSDATDKTGIPCFNAGPYASDWQSCYVEIQNAADGTEFLVQAGDKKGEKVFGRTVSTGATSPDSIKVEFFSVPLGQDLSSGTAYTWEASQPSAVDMFYGYFQRFDQANESVFRTVQTLGLAESGGLRQDITDLQSVVGTADNAVSLAGTLTNTSANFAFADLGTATPAVVTALNTLNAQIGDRTYSGSILGSGQAVSTSLQALSTAISNLSAAMNTSSTTRVIERLAVDAPANTAHSLPAGLSYLMDDGGNGNNLWVFWRGILRDPGSIISGNDYAETSTTTIMPYTKISAGDHITYIILTH